MPMSDEDVITYLLGLDNTTYDPTGPIDYGGVTVNPDGTANPTPFNFGNVLKGLTDILGGTSSLGKLGSVIGAGGLYSLLNNMMGGGSGTTTAGYRGGIPAYTATRTQTPYAQQRPEGYRPGQGGITYFNPIQYQYLGKNLTAPIVGAPAPASEPAPAPASEQSGGGDGMAAGGDVDLRNQIAAEFDRYDSFAQGGIASLAEGGGRFLRGPGDGVSDSIPARFDKSGQPARLADGEFVVDARTVSELGNGSSEAGARKLYKMMDQVHKARRKAKRGEPSGADKFLPK